MGTSMLYLKNGIVIEAHHSEEDFDDIYARWEKGRDILAFDNCSVRAEEVAAIGWQD